MGVSVCSIAVVAIPIQCITARVLCGVALTEGLKQLQLAIIYLNFRSVEIQLTLPTIFEIYVIIPLLMVSEVRN